MVLKTLKFLAAESINHSKLSSRGFIQRDKSPISHHFPERNLEKFCQESTEICFGNSISPVF